MGGDGDQVGGVSWVEMVIRWVGSFVGGAGDQVGGVFCWWSVGCGLPVYECVNIEYYDHCLPTPTPRG